MDGIIDSMGHEFEQAQGDGEGQGSLACCSPWCQKESDMTEQLNNNSEALGQVDSHVAAPSVGPDSGLPNVPSHPPFVLPVPTGSLESPVFLAWS